jgi:hypothetical protein
MHKNKNKQTLIPILGSRVVCLTCTRTYAHKRPTPKPRPPKPHLKAKKEVLNTTDTDESDIIWQDDPHYEEKMAKLYPNEGEAKARLILFFSLFFLLLNKTKLSKKMEKNKKELVLFQLNKNGQTLPHEGKRRYVLTLFLLFFFIEEIENK